ITALHDDLPVAPPQFDSAAVEQARLVRLARDHIASHESSVDYDGLARGRDSTVLAARQWVKRQRAKGRLFVVDHGNATLIPSFQLDEVFDLDERVAAVVERLTAGGLHGWAQWQWFSAINPWIDARPVDLVRTDDGLADVHRAVDGLLDA
ncbi:MAG: hypothetical protein AAFP84_17620, partial [Actinomycetota bacterium]